MHVEALVALLLERRVESPGKQLEVEHALRQHAHRRLVRRDPLASRANLRDGRVLRGEYQLVDLALRAAEAPVHREGARDVRGIAVELAAGIDQQQIAVAQRRIVEYVVQHAGIGAPRHDRRVGGKLRAAAAEFIQQLGLDLVLVASGPHGLHGPAVRRGGDARRAPHDRLLVRVLHHAHVVDQRAHVLDSVRRGDTGAHPGAHRVQPLHGARVPFRVVADRVIERGLILEQAGERFVERFDRVRGVETEALARRLGAIAKPLPDLAFLAAGAAKKQRLRRLAGDDDQGGAGLGEAGQIIKVAVEAVRVVRVAVAHALGRGRNDRDPRLHGPRQPLAALPVEQCVFSDFHVAMPVAPPARRVVRPYPRPAKFRCKARR